MKLNYLKWIQQETKMQSNTPVISYDTLWSMKQPNFDFFAIVSSTFTDTAVERNILMHRILPELRLMARQYTNINICLVDLRWGLKDSNTNDHLTWISCANEITRCRKESGGVFFISVLFRAPYLKTNLILVYRTLLSWMISKWVKEKGRLS